MFKRKTIISIALISLIITCLTPFIFGVYLLEKPATQIISFGTPFPFISTEIQFTKDITFPLKVKFQFENLHSFQLMSFLLSYISIFILTLSVISIITRFIKKDYRNRV